MLEHASRPRGEGPEPAPTAGREAVEPAPVTAESAPAATAAPVGAPSPSRYCRRCHYELAGLPVSAGAATVTSDGPTEMPGGAGATTEPQPSRDSAVPAETEALARAACPECGAAFDPADPRSTLARPPRRGVWTMRLGVPLLAVLLAAVASREGWLPSPVSRWDLRLWEWRRSSNGPMERYGLLEIRRGTRRALQWCWGTRVWSTRMINADGSELWGISVDRAGRWRLRSREDVSRTSLLGTFTAMKQEMFGVRFLGFERDQTRAPLAIDGTTTDVMEALVNEFGVTVEPVLVRGDQEYVWYYDAGARGLRTARVQEAGEAGFSLPRGGRGMGFADPPDMVPRDQRPPGAPRAMHGPPAPDPEPEQGPG